MAWILSALWSAVWSRSSATPARGAGVQASGGLEPGPSVSPKRFYSLMIEVRPEEADAATLELFSDTGSPALAARLNLPAGCELRRCMIVSAESAEVLIRM
jgi:hypothetical protein